MIDRATDEAIQNLMAAGLLAKTVRAARPLFPEGEAVTLPPLSGAEQAKIEELRAQSGRKLKMARLLGDGEFLDEARAALLAAIQALGQALAVENRLPEPSAPEETIQAPLSICWRDALPLVRGFVSDRTQPWKPVTACLEKT